jgi:excisionase family DNA binding protein
MKPSNPKDLQAHEVRPKFYTIEGVATHLDVASRTVHRWVADRKLIVHRIGRSVRVSAVDLKAFLDAHRDED